jgi:hypothetical protein
MEPEYRLDALLSEQWNGSRRAAPGAPSDDELAPLVVAVDRLTALRRANPAPAFARTLETQLRSRADHLRAVAAAGAAGAAGAPAERSPTSQSSTALPPALRRLRPVLAERPIQRVPRAVWPALAAAAVLALVFGTYTAAANAGPDSPLYVVRRVEQGVQLQIAPNDAARVQLHVQAANEALGQLNAAARRHDNGAYSIALGTLREEAAAASHMLTTIPAGADADALATQLSDLQTRMRQDLAADLSFVNWQNRLSTTTALGGLDVAAPHVSAVSVIRTGSDGRGDGTGTGEGSGDSHGSQPRTDQVTVSGSGFRPGAMLMVDGRAAGKVIAITVTPTQIVALVQDENVEHAQYIGVSNPDGTAAQTKNIHVQDRPDDGGNGDDKHPGATPTVTITATPGGHGGDSGG